MRIEFGDLRLGEEARQHLLDVLATNWASMGPKVKKFEEEWSKLFDYKHSVAMSSGTDGNINSCLVLYDYGAQRGDEIILPALSFISPANGVLAAGFKPVFVDVERETLNINPKKIEEKITPKTRAIIAVHTMGKPSDMSEILEIARKNSLVVIEDACEAHGARYNGKFVGHWGDMAIFSYYAAHLICCAEGGMISTNNGEIAKILGSTRSHGRRDGSLYFDHVRLGLNSKMNDLEASLGLEGIKNFWDVFNKRKENLYYLLKKVADLERFAYFNSENDYEIVSPHAFSVTLKDPRYNCSAFADFLSARSINQKRNFGSIPTQHRAFAFLGHTLGEFPEAEYIGDNGIHFGIHQFLSREDLDYVSDVLHEYFKQFS